MCHKNHYLKKKTITITSNKMKDFDVIYSIDAVFLRIELISFCNQKVHEYNVLFFKSYVFQNHFLGFLKIAQYLLS